MAGILYIVATPIGNLGDITLRALEVLKNVDYIACEDTRVTKKLLNHYDIKNKMICYNDYNENYKSDELVKLIEGGNDIALVSDAGTPTISDPGFRIVNKSLLKGIKINSITGASSAIAALSISGMPTDKFYFEGFLPKKKGRLTRLKYLSSIDGTIIIFESPKRVIKTLRYVLDLLGNRTISVVKEISKIHETVYIGTIEKVLTELELKAIKGEFVVLIAKEGFILDE